jgi:SCY1-like protein 1
MTDNRIKYVDSIETETHVYIATERVRPLQGVLRDTDLKGKAKEEWIGWGVKSISVSRHI